MGRNWRSSKDWFYPPHWKVGDEKDVTIGGSINETVTMVIVGLNHDDKADGSGKAPITLGMKNLMTTQKQMNKTDTNVGSFVGTDMYLWLQADVFPNLPIELQKLITPVTKKTTAGGSSLVVRNDNMKLWFFSSAELNIDATEEGFEYEYYIHNTSLIKRMINGAGVPQTWWLRSPYPYVSTYFMSVTTKGQLADSMANAMGAVCFGFAIDAPSESYAVGNKDGGATHPPSGKQYETVPYQIDGSSRGIVKTVSGTPVEVEYLVDRSYKSVEIIKKMPNAGVNITVGIAP